MRTKPMITMMRGDGNSYNGDGDGDCVHKLYVLIMSSSPLNLVTILD